MQYILWDDWPIFMISALNGQLQQELEYTLLKSDYHNWWISKMQSGREDTLEERYAIKLCFKLEKLPQKHMKCFSLLLKHLAWIKHQFLSGIRDSRKAGSLWGMMRGVGGVRKSEHQSWLAKGLGFRLLCWGFKGVQEEISSEKASTLQTRTMHQSTTPSLSQTIEEMKEAVTKVIDMLTQENFHVAFQKLLEWYKCIAAGGKVWKLT